MLTIGTYGGRILQEYVLITGLASGTTSSKDSGALKKNIFFSKITRLQQKNSVDEYTCEWEALSTRVLELNDDQ